MKKLLVLASAAALLVSCSNEELTNTSNNTPDGAPLSEYEPIVFSAGNLTTVSFTRAIVNKWDGTQRAGLFVVEDDANSNWKDTTKWELHPFTENVPCIVNNAPVLINELKANETSNVAFVKDPETFEGADQYYYPRTTIGEEPKNYMLFGYHPFVQKKEDNIKMNASSIEISGEFVEYTEDPATKTLKPGKSKDIMAWYSRVTKPLDPDNIYGWNSRYIKALRAQGKENELPEINFQHMTSLLLCKVSGGDNYSFADYGIANAYIIVPKSYKLVLGKTEGATSVANVDLQFSWGPGTTWKEEEQEKVFLLGEEIPVYDGKAVNKGDLRMYAEDGKNYKAYLVKNHFEGNWSTADVIPYAKYYVPGYKLTDVDNTRVSEIKAILPDFEPEEAKIDSTLFAPTQGIYKRDSAVKRPLDIYITQYNQARQLFSVEAPSGEDGDGYFHANHVYTLQINMVGSELVKVKASLNPWNGQEEPLKDITIGGNDKQE